jgi:hypothetical protein
VTRTFARFAESQHGRPLLEEFPGRVLNGLGYSAIAHVEAAPQMSLWRSLLPDVPESILQSTFNRYAHIIISDEAELRSPQADVALLPKRLLMPRVEVVETCEPTAIAAGRIAARAGVDVQDGASLVFAGSVPAAGVFRDQVFQVVTRKPVSVNVDVEVEPGQKVDAHRDEHQLVLTIDGQLGGDPLCVLFVDERTGTTVALDDPTVTGECDACLVR